MKKIFTLIFSLGLITASFAQGGTRHQDAGRTNSSYSQPPSHPTTSQDYRMPSYNNQNDKNYTDQRDHQSYGQRNDDRRYEQDDHRGFNSRDDMHGGYNTKRIDKKMYNSKMNNRYPYQSQSVHPLLQLVLGLLTSR